MSSLSIFVFDNADNFVIRRDLTSSELAAKSATFSLPKSLASTPCSFYAIANYDASSAKTRAALTALVEKSAADYNGTFAEVSTAAKRSGGFVMSGMKSQTVGAVNSIHHHGAHSGGYGGGGNLQNILHGSQPEQVFNQFKQAADLMHHHH